MKNVVLFIIDSLFSDCLGNNKTKESSTPFIDKLINEGVFAPNVYSFGPYTDAATKGLLCGQPTLDDFGFYYSINGSKYNHYSVFKDNGYHTIGLYYPYYLLSDKVTRSIDQEIFTSGFVYGSVWFGKYKYYSELDKLNSFDYKVLEKMTDMLFNCWEGFYSTYEKDELSKTIVRHLKKEDGNGQILLSNERQKYENDKKAYIDEILKLKMNHSLATINDFDFARNINRDLLDNTFTKHKSFFDNIYKLNKKANASLNYKVALAKRAFSYLVHRRENDLRYVKNYQLLFSNTKLMKKRVFTDDNWQLEASARKQVDALINALEIRDKSVPFFATLHVEEPHHNIDFFSFDTTKQEDLDEEIEYLKPLLNNLGSDFKGNVMYQLSLRYVDFCVKKMFDALGKMNLLGDTIVLITADHGSSYYFNPLRDSVTNNFFEENYKIPLIIWGSGFDKGIYDNFYNSSNILPTLLDCVGIKNNYFAGKSIFDSNQKFDHTIIEYTGPGCPDLTRRDIWIAGRNKQFKIAYKNPLFNDFKYDSPVEVYDEINDPQELNNIKDDYSKLIEDKNFSKLILEIRKRFSNIKDNTKNIIDNFDNYKVIK